MSNPQGMATRTRARSQSCGPELTNDSNSKGVATRTRSRSRDPEPDKPPKVPAASNNSSPMKGDGKKRSGKRGSLNSLLPLATPSNPSKSKSISQLINPAKPGTVSVVRSNQAGTKTPKEQIPPSKSSSAKSKPTTQPTDSPNASQSKLALLSKVLRPIQPADSSRKSVRINNIPQTSRPSSEPHDSQTVLQENLAEELIAGIPVYDTSVIHGNAGFSPLSDNTFNDGDRFQIPDCLDTPEDTREDPSYVDPDGESLLPLPDSFTHSSHATSTALSQSSTSTGGPQKRKRDSDTGGESSIIRERWDVLTRHQETSGRYGVQKAAMAQKNISRQGSTSTIQGNKDQDNQTHEKGSKNRSNNDHVLGKEDNTSRSHDDNHGTDNSNSDNDEDNDDDDDDDDDDNNEEDEEDSDEDERPRKRIKTRRSKSNIRFDPNGPKHQIRSYPPNDQDLLGYGKKLYEIWLITCDAFPTHKDRAINAERCFDKAVKDLPALAKKSTIEKFNPQIRRMFIEVGSSIRGAMKTQGRSIVKEYYQFKAPRALVSDSLKKNKKSKAINRKAIRKNIRLLLQDDNFIHGSFQEHELEPFAHPAICELLFRSIYSKPSKIMERYVLPEVSGCMLALAATVLRTCLDEWAKGKPQDIEMTEDQYGTVYRRYCNMWAAYTKEFPLGRPVRARRLLRGIRATLEHALQPDSDTEEEPPAEVFRFGASEDDPPTEDEA